MKNKKRWLKYLLLAGLIVLAMALGRGSFAAGDSSMKISQKTEAACEPTPPDALGPFYKPEAPLRTSVGKGYILAGAVKSSTDCSPIAGARLEFWLAGPNGQYDDDHRATIVTDDEGRYQFESTVPPPYSGRPAHIHIRASAPGSKTLVTQHYPAPGQNKAAFDLVLVPVK
jgi:protocatechuate 3,4-dioxygenase beta subunit